MDNAHREEEAGSLEGGTPHDKVDSRGYGEGVLLQSHAADGSYQSKNCRLGGCCV